MANARLIAAAPDLLEALRDLVAQCDDTGDDFGARERAIAAITKSTTEKP